jgi:hypothetical protein
MYGTQWQYETAVDTGIGLALETFNIKRLEWLEPTFM